MKLEKKFKFKNEIKFRPSLIISTAYTFLVQLPEITLLKYVRGRWGILLPPHTQNLLNLYPYHKYSVYNLLFSVYAI